MSVGVISAAIGDTCVSATIGLMACIRRISRYVYLSLRVR
jgi:hypothetical protein